MSRPQWHEDNLGQHYAKRSDVNRDCWLVQSSCSHNPFTRDEYRARSEKVLDTAFLIYKAEQYDGKRQSYREICIYHYDDQLVLTICDIMGRRIITCYHHHRVARFCHDILAMPVGERRMHFIDWLYNSEDGKIIRNLEIIKGEKVIRKYQKKTRKS